MIALPAVPRRTSRIGLVDFSKKTDKINRIILSLIIAQFEMIFHRKNFLIFLLTYWENDVRISHINILFLSKEYEKKE